MPIKGKNAVIVISSHLKLSSLKEFVNETISCDRIIFVTSQQLYPNEILLLTKIFGDIETCCFSDLMSDSEGEACDANSFIPYKEQGKTNYRQMGAYFDDLTKEKNKLLIKKVEAKYTPSIKLIASADLGIVVDEWLKEGYKKISGEYYYVDIKSTPPLMKRIFQKHLLKRIARRLKINFPEHVYVSEYEGQKLLFFGHLERAGYRFNLTFKESKTEAFKTWIVKNLYFFFHIKWKRNVQYMTTLHEYGNYAYYDLIDDPAFNNLLIQDGYLPPNDTTRYLYFYGKYSKYYSWDKLGSKLFNYYNLPVSIMPFRKNYPLPIPKFNKVRKVLCVSSGAGDWTAIKNRSDDERVVVVLGKLAKKYPDIQFVLRCHPSWVSPGIQGVNSIQRVVDYISYLGVSNYVVSSNIPSIKDKDGNFVCSHSRNSFEKDLEGVDLVLGVHSIAQIDAALKSIPFATVNLSGRRNLFKSISDLGFPYCENYEMVESIIENIETQSFKDNYIKAVNLYNKVIEEI